MKRSEAGAAEAPRILIVRLGALGDLVHALPAVASLRERYPDARIDWIAHQRHLEFLRMVPCVDRRLSLPNVGSLGIRVALPVIRALRREHYDVAVELQGLVKSAVLARLSGARRVVGFARGHLREGPAGMLYTEHVDPGTARHVIEKNLAIAGHLGGAVDRRRFPLRVPDSDKVGEVRTRLGLDAESPFAVLNPGGAWPNKRWPPERFGAIASWLGSRRGLKSIVVWGPGEEALAHRVVGRSDGHAAAAPETTIAELSAILRAARLMVAGDTGPTHIAAALGVPVVGIYGPTDPRRNGPWSERDRVVSRYDDCICHHQRRCRRDRWCLDDVSAEDVERALDAVLGGSVEEAT